MARQKDLDEAGGQGYTDNKPSKPFHEMARKGEVYHMPDEFPNYDKANVFDLTFLVHGTKEIVPQVRWASGMIGYEPNGFDAVRSIGYFMRGMDITSVDEVFGLANTDRIDELSISNNKINEIEPLTRMPWASNIKSLNLGGNNIDHIPDLSVFINLESLSLSGNKIERIEGISRLNKLEALSLIGNRISRIEGIEKLEKLTELYLSSNQLIEIDVSSILSLKKLMVFNVTQNRINHIPNISMFRGTNFVIGQNPVTSIERATIDAARDGRILIGCEPAMWHQFFAS